MLGTGRLHSVIMFALFVDCTYLHLIKAYLHLIKHYKGGALGHVPLFRVEFDRDKPPWVCINYFTAQTVPQEYIWVFDYLENTFGNLDKYICQLRQIVFSFIQRQIWPWEPSVSLLQEHQRPEAVLQVQCILHDVKFVLLCTLRVCIYVFFLFPDGFASSFSRLPCYVFRICMSTDRNPKCKSVELGDQLIQAVFIDNL